ncbi:hypothetical protein FHU38_003308 [Saccharomonospora amisosensis]|uniref:Uncharacterized protein n=1 Tax=Saccharomonospora amisosensis TaxID=1128677 RepID=A0A7X5URN8_9PSEU|nr:hypothetical protein [Saccharomonospora amisosensis]
MTATPTEVDFHFDPMCPWVSVNRGRIIEVPKPTGGHS